MRHIYTVKEVTYNIKEILEQNFTYIWVKGEVSDLRMPLSGHFYFVLKDKESQLSAAIFNYFAKDFKFVLENGLEIITQGRISVYAKQGKYQLIVEAIEPAGKGALQLAFEQLKKKLKEEGLFAESHKKPIPFLPKKIGVVTSSTGAAIQDIINVMERRFPNVGMILYPVRVQGEEAPGEIVEAVESFNKRKDIDVLIVGRGGGSIEDLWAFNEEKVARAIYNSNIPIISAVGHEIDFTIADFVADLRAPTPSAAAELVVQNKEELIRRLENTSFNLIKAFKNKFTLYKNKLFSLLESYAFKQPKDRIIQYYQHLDDLIMEGHLKINHKLALSKSVFSALMGKLNALSPLSILERGYSISLKLPEREIIKDVKQVNLGDNIEVKVHQGAMICEIGEIRNGRGN